MIQEYLMYKAQAALPLLEWTVDNVTGEQMTGTVYYEGGGKGNPENETKLRYPEYQFYFKSSKEDWSVSQIAAYTVHDLLDGLQLEELVEVPKLNKSYRVYYIQATTEPLRIGVIDDIQEYSVNFQVTLREEI
jgi:hypothetical protein